MWPLYPYIATSPTIDYIFHMKAEPNIKGIIFDKDGTLFNYSEVWGPIIGRSITTIMKVFNLQNHPTARRRLADFVGVDQDGYINPKGILFNHEEIIRGSLKFISFCLKCHLNPIKTVLLFKRLLAESQTVGLDKILSEIDFSNIHELFNKLEAKGIIVGVVTNDSTESTKICLETMGIADQVQFLKTKDSNCRKKPSPQAIEQFCRTFSLKPEEVAVVGDTNADMTFADRGKAGYKVGLLSGAGDLKAIEKLADVIYPDISSLLTDPVLNLG
jgi:haloacid dehalogenase superfamily, subfamily IA, variant 1 with third motif having Dx(3-4)D or Dx(3-4)E